MPNIILVTGSRLWTDKLAIEIAFSVHKPDMIIEGGASGADLLSKEVIEKEGKEYIQIDAEWKKFGKKAGPARNERMVRMNPNLVLAFHDTLGNSKGTKDCVLRALKHKIPVILVKHATMNGAIIMIPIKDERDVH